MLAGPDFVQHCPFLSRSTLRESVSPLLMFLMRHSLPYGKFWSGTPRSSLA